MKVLKVSWNEDDDITKITYSDDFKSTHWVDKLDVMVDVINELSSHYNKILLLSLDNGQKYNFDNIED